MTTKLSNDLLQTSPSFRNRLINSAFQINQRGAGTQNIGSSYQYPVDGWHTYASCTGTITSAIATATPAPNAKNYMVLTCTTAKATLLTGEYGFIAQTIEGIRTEDLAWSTANAVPLVVTFYARASVTGAYGGALFSYNATRSFTFNYTINAANTWELKTIIIPADSFALATGTQASLRLAFCIGSGATNLTATSGWNAGTYFGVTGASNVFSATSRSLWIASPQLEVGGAGSPFEFRTYDQDLLDCQRYYFRQQATATSQSFFLPLNVVSSTVATGLVRFPVSMRIAPTALEQSSTAGNYAINTVGALTTCSAVPAFGTATTVGTTVTLTAASGLVAGHAGHISSSAASGTSAYLGWSAEFV